MSNIKEFESIHPDWCPGCGDFGVLASLKRVLAAMDIKSHDVMTVSGIGCSSNFPGFINTYGMHTLHGRSLPIAQGFKLSNHKMHVVAVGGDGDGYGIGMGHLVHAMRRNIDMTYIVMNNSIYGLTTGQTSPTSDLNMKTKSTPFGNPELPINPITLALGSGCGFVGRVFSGNIKEASEVYRAAIEHPGFSLVDTFSPCVTFNRINTAQFYREKCKNINQKGHNTSNMTAAFREATATDYIATGIFYQQVRPQYEESERETLAEPICRHPLGLTTDQQQELCAELR